MISLISLVLHFDIYIIYVLSRVLTFVHVLLYNCAYFFADAFDVSSRAFSYMYMIDLSTLSERAPVHAWSVGYGAAQGWPSPSAVLGPTCRMLG